MNQGYELNLKDRLILNGPRLLDAFRLLSVVASLYVCVTFFGADRALSDHVSILAILGLGLFAPTALLYPAHVVWETVTPIRNLTTFWEDEIVFLLSAVTGLSVGLTCFSTLPIVETLRLASATTLCVTPTLFLRWLGRRYLLSLGQADTRTMKGLAAPPISDKERSYFRNALLCWLAAGLTTGFSQIVIVGGGLVLIGALELLIPVMSTLAALIVIYVVGAPLMVGAGHSYLKIDADKPGRCYAFGGFAICAFFGSFTLFANLNNPMLLLGLASIYFVVFISFILGGWAMSKVVMEPDVTEVFA